SRPRSGRVRKSMREVNVTLEKFAPGWRLHFCSRDSGRLARATMEARPLSQPEQGLERQGEAFAVIPAPHSPPSVRPKTLPAGSRLSPRASCDACLPSVFRAAFVCG